MLLDSLIKCEIKASQACEDLLRHISSSRTATEPSVSLFSLRHSLFHLVRVKFETQAVTESLEKLMFDHYSS